MTKREILEALKDLPDDTVIYVENADDIMGDYWYTPLYSIEKTKAFINKHGSLQADISNYKGDTEIDIYVING